jgi:hypothetical protein
VRRLLPVLLFATLALASCGGGDDKENVQDLLDKAFSSSIKSADLKLDASVQLKGSPGLDKPVRISASGPFRTNDKQLPSVDIDLKIGTDGGGQTVTTGFLSTGDRAFVKFQDIYYEQPAAQVAQANRAIAQNAGRCVRWASIHAAGCPRPRTRVTRRSPACRRATCPESSTWRR